MKLYPAITASLALALTLATNTGAFAAEKDARTVATEFSKIGITINKTVTPPNKPDVDTVSAGCTTPPADKPICLEMAKFSCAQGEYDDGTGVARVNKLGASNQQLTGEDFKQAQNVFIEALKNPDNAYFTKMAAKTTGMNTSPFCNSPDNDDIKTCRENIAASLADYALKQIFLGTDINPKNGEFLPGSLEEKMFLTENILYTNAEKKISELMSNKFKDKKLEEKIANKIFPAMRSLVIAQINRNVKDPATRELMANKVRSIQFAGTNCKTEENRENPNNVSGLLLPNAFYNPLSHSFTFCNGMALNNQSEFQIAHTIAHELAHSIDPCNIVLGHPDLAYDYKSTTTREKMEADFPFPNLLNCLRDEKSIHARPAPPDDEPLADNQLLFCYDDQIGESFADWIATETTPEYMTNNHPKLTQKQMQLGYANIFRRNCENEANLKAKDTKDVHPWLEDRINKLILTQPQIRKQMGCLKNEHPEFIHCPRNPQ
jgi:hypothetical protein